MYDPPGGEAAVYFPWESEREEATEPPKRSEEPAILMALQDVAAIRARLAQVTREASVLRRLLKIAVREAGKRESFPELYASDTNGNDH